MLLYLQQIILLKFLSFNNQIFFQTLGIDFEEHRVMLITGKPFKLPYTLLDPLQVFP